MDFIDKEQKHREERIESLNKSIKNKEEALQRRMDRVARQQEIAEAAANENKDSNELKMQENYMVQKMWSQFLKKKMEREMKRTYEIEDAFQKIRASTGLTDVQEIVHKFLTREQTYSQLLMAVSDNERKIDNLRRENEHWREKLHDMQMQQADDESAQGAKKGGPGALLSPELTTLDNKINNLRKQCEKAEELNKKVQLVNDQVVGWTGRISQKIDQQFNENISSQFDSSNSQKILATIFSSIASAVCKQIQTNVIDGDDFAGGDDDEKPMINLTAFLNDFGHQDFLDKNVRVRPVSGQTRAG